MTESKRMSRVRQTCMLGLVSVWTSAAAMADNWPAWRGAKNDGLTSETDCPLQWGAEQNVLWKVPVPGEGHSSPIVWEDRIFVTACVPEDLTRRLCCFDRETGQQRWQQVVAKASIEEMHRDNTAASTTPATDGKHVFVSFCVDGHIQVSAYDFHGKPVWTVFPGSFVSRHGFSTALIVEGDRLFLSGLQDGDDAFVAALACESGETLWRVERPRHIRSFSTPQLCQLGDRPALLLSGADQTIAYDRETGATLWELEGPAEKTVSSIVTCESSGLAFVCGGRDKQLLAISLQDVPSAPAASERVAWKVSRAIPYMTSPLASNGLLHILSDEGVYSCFETSSGKLLRRARPLGPVRASMVATPDRIYATERDGRTTVIANDSEWHVLAVNDVGEEIYASPAISNGDFILRTVEHLMLIREQAE